MKKLIIMALAAMASLTSVEAAAQYKATVTDNPFDGKTVAARTGIDKTLYFVQWNDARMEMRLWDGYICTDDLVSLNIAVLVGGDWKKMTVPMKPSDTREFMYIRVVPSSPLMELFDWMKAGTTVKLRYSNAHCSSEQSTFSAAGFTKAISKFAMPSPEDLPRGTYVFQKNPDATPLNELHFTSATLVVNGVKRPETPGGAIVIEYEDCVALKTRARNSDKTITFRQSKNSFVNEDGEIRLYVTKNNYYILSGLIK